MIRHTDRILVVTLFLLLAPVLVAGAGGVPAARAADVSPAEYWHIPVRVIPGAWQDSTLLVPSRCEGLFRGPLPDSIREQARTITVRFRRNPAIEARPDFGGYRVFRVTGTPDTTAMQLIRRFSLNPGDDALWHFSVADPVTQQLMCGGAPAYDEWVSFVDPDSNGSLQKVCRRVDHLGRCLSIGDSVWKLVVPPGPHDGFRTWYSVTYEGRNVNDNNYEDLFVPDTSDAFARCAEPGKASTCPNLNNKLANITADPTEPTAGPTPNLRTVAVVPNPYRADEAWDKPGGHEVHFINLPPNARIRVYTVSGDLVRDLKHEDLTRDFERWDLKNADGRDVSSGIYMYRVESGSFSAQNRLIVIR